jgi:hypothetical protein
MRHLLPPFEEEEEEHDKLSSTLVEGVVFAGEGAQPDEETGRENFRPHRPFD